MTDTNTIHTMAVALAKLTKEELVEFAGLQNGLQLFSFAKRLFCGWSS
jgi:hypothetical protein